MKRFLYGVLVVATLFDICAGVYLYVLTGEPKTYAARPNLHPVQNFGNLPKIRSKPLRMPHFGGH